MGSYNSQYESYYNGMANKRKNYNGGSYSSRTSVHNEGNYLIKRLTRDLVGVLILFTFVIGCKLIVTPKTTAAYNYSKELLNTNYDYTKIMSSTKDINLKTIEQKVTDWIDSVKAKIGGGKTITEKIKEDFSLPLQGVVTSPFGERIDPITKEKKMHQGIDIDAKEGTEVKAAFDGKIKDCGEDAELGNYILIDHGNGIESKYGHLSEITVKKDDSVKKSQVIAKSGNTGKSTGPHLHFEILYMGENKNPADYFTISLAQ